MKDKPTYFKEYKEFINKDATNEEIEKSYQEDLKRANTANQDNRIDTHQVLRLLVRNRDHPDPDPHVIDRAIKQFPAYVQLAVLTRDTRLALEVWELADTLPKTETEQSLFLEGIQLDGSLLSSLDNKILKCFKGTTPCVLKATNRSEQQRFEALKDTKLTSDYIVKMDYHYSPKKELFIVMPLMPTTLEHLKQLTFPHVIQLWKQMENALQCLHDQQFAHMDVKPANICIDHKGNFILIDLGSAIQFGKKTSSTRAYHPVGLFSDDSLTSQVSRANVDWWMLIAVISERGFAIKWGGIRNLSQQQLMDTIKNEPELFSLLEKKL